MNDQILNLLACAVQDKVFPGAAVGYIKKGQEYFVSAGNLTYDKSSPNVNQNTLYDLASITKSIPVSSIILHLLGQNKLSLDDKVIKYIPELKFKYKNDVTIKHLLTYTVVWDMPNGLAHYAKQGSEVALNAIFNGPLMAPPGQKYYYTNPPSILLTMIIERICGKSLDKVASKLFFEPLNMQSTTFYPKDLKDKYYDIAPTEIDFRGELHGVVHDETAWALHNVNKLAGNAGLFSNSEDLLKLCQMLLFGGNYKDHKYFNPDIFNQIYTNQIANLGEVTGLGWELNSPAFMGKKASDTCFGKTGFTGCVILVDPVKQSAMVMLTNRTYPDRSNNRVKINQTRSKIADIIFA